MLTLCFHRFSLEASRIKMCSAPLAVVRRSPRIFGNCHEVNEVPVVAAFYDGAVEVDYFRCLIFQFSLLCRIIKLD